VVAVAVAVAEDAVVVVVALVAADAAGVVVPSEAVVLGGVTGGIAVRAADVVAPAGGLMELADADTVFGAVADCGVGA
jgi:hypothetical protein